CAVNCSYFDLFLLQTSSWSVEYSLSFNEMTLPCLQQHFCLYYRQTRKELLNMTNELASKIDHTLLKPESTEADIIRICHEAKEYEFYSVCIQNYCVLIAQQY